MQLYKDKKRLQMVEMWTSGRQKRHYGRVSGGASLDTYMNIGYFDGVGCNRTLE